MRPLAHPTRAALLEAIRARPGVATVELAARLSLNLGTLAHHLRALEDASLVRSLLAGRNRAWFGADVRALPAPPPERRAVLAAVERAPGVTQAQLARATGLAKATVHHHVARLARAGALDVRREGREAHLFARRPHQDL